MHTPYAHTPYAHTLYTHPMHTLCTHPIHTPYTHPLYTHPIHTRYTHTLYTHPMHTPYTHPLYTHTLYTHLRKQDNSLFSRAVAAANQHQASSTRAVGGGAPMWLEHAQKAVGRKLKEYVTVDGHWDVYIVSKVMQGYFREAFAPKLGHQNTSGHSIPLHELESRNCTVLGTLLQTLERRTRRAHTVNEPTTTEAEVLDSLRCMAEVLEQFQGPAAAAGMQQLLEEAHALVKVCRSNSGIAPTPTKPFAVATEHAQRLLAHTLSTSLSASCSWPWAPSNTRMGLRLAATGQVCRHDRPVQRAP